MAAQSWLPRTPRIPSRASTAATGSIPNSSVGSTGERSTAAVERSASEPSAALTPSESSRSAWVSSRRSASATCPATVWPMRESMSCSRIREPSTTTSTPSGLKPGVFAHCATFPGSPTPLTSTTTRSRRPAMVRTRSRASAKPSASEQHTQPLARESTSPSSAARSPSSMPISPKSLTSTAMRWPCGSASRALTRVVLPAPRYPPTTRRGRRCCRVSMGAVLRRSGRMGAGRLSRRGRAFLRAWFPRRGRRGDRPGRW